MSELDPNALLAGQRASMVADGCGYTVNGEHVLCDDPRVQDDHRQTECSCKRNATAAITAYLSTVSPLSDGDGWQPIETCPHDESRIDLWVHGERVANAFYRDGNWLIWRRSSRSSRAAGGHWVPHYASISGVPTHWRPLPAPPRDEVA